MGQLVTCSVAHLLVSCEMMMNSWTKFNPYLPRVNEHWNLIDERGSR